LISFYQFIVIEAIEKKEKEKERKRSGQFPAIFRLVRIHTSQCAEHFFPDMAFLNIYFLAAFLAFYFYYFQIKSLLLIPITYGSNL